jgi:hypothetical protein
MDGFSIAMEAGKGHGTILIAKIAENAAQNPKTLPRMTRIA